MTRIGYESQIAIIERSDLVVVHSGVIRHG